MTVVDFDQLQAVRGPRVVLMPSTTVSQSTTGADFSDFSVFAGVYITAHVQLRDGHRGQPSMTVTVEHSDDGLSWSTGVTLQCADGKQSALLSSPKTHLRAVAAPGGSSEWQVVEVTAAPTYLDAPGGGGSPPVGVVYNSTLTLVPTGGSYTPLAFGTVVTGDPTLFDLTDPTSLVAVDDGWYHVTASFNCDDAMTVGKWYTGIVLFDAAGAGVVNVSGSAPPATLDGNGYVGVSLFYGLSAGQSLQVAVDNWDSEDRHFRCAPLTIVKVA